MNPRKRARDEEKQLHRRLRPRHQPRGQEESSTHSGDLDISPAGSRPELVATEVVAQTRETTDSITEDTGTFRHITEIGEEDAHPGQVPIPVATQTAHLPQPGPSPPRPLDQDSSMIAATTPLEQSAGSAIVGIKPYNKIPGQLSSAASASSLAEARRGEEAFYGQPELPTLVASRTGSRSSSGLGYHSQTGSGGVFSGAHNFSIGHMNAVEAQSVGTQSVWTQNVAAQYQLYMDTNSLENMLPYVIPGAEFNSAARDPPPKCHPNTRIQIRADLHNCINGTTRLIWMHGPAGVGKSAIMQTIAETVSTCATLFFARSSDPPRNDSKKVFTTLAYSLAVSNDSYYKYIEAKLSKDPFFLEKSLAEQFHRLFIAPFIGNLVDTGHQRWVVLLDGLDECKNDENDQCRIVDLIRDSILNHTGTTPFVWIIASRPEAHLMAALRKLKENFRDCPAEFWERGIPVDSDDAVQDIERYLHTEFTKIREDNLDSFPDPASTWPSNGDFLKVAKASSGLFVFASTLTKYISVDRPASRLKLIIALIDQPTIYPTGVSQGPFSLLDMLYTQVMSDIPDNLLPIAKALLGYFRLASQGLIYGHGLVDACNALGLCQDEAYDALRKLHSVLVCPPPNGARFRGIEFFHASFSDFLFDHSRSQKYHVDLSQELTNIWWRYIGVLRESCQANLTGPTPNNDGVNIHWVPGDDGSRLDKLQDYLLWRAQNECVSILIKYGHLWCTTCPLPIDGIYLRVGAPELIDVFRSIHPVLFHTETHLMNGFLWWVDTHAPRAIQETMISQGFPMSRLDTERLFRSICITPWCWYVVPYVMRHINITVAAQYDNASRWSRVKGEIRRSRTKIYSFDLGEVVEAVDAKALQRCTIRVIGMEPSALCVVVGPFSARFGFAGDAFYVLPYSEI